MDTSTVQFVTPTQWTDESNVTELCTDRRLNSFVLLHGSLGVSVILLAILSFLTKRKNLNLDCCGGRPAVAIPINLLDDYENRWPYAFAFGAITSTIVGIFTGEYFDFEAPVWAKVLIGILTGIEICVIYYPFFACVATDYKFSGCIIGFLYAAAWFAADVIRLIDCLDPIPEVIPKANLVIQLPALVCLGLITLWFLYGFIYYARKRCILGENIYKAPHEITSEWQFTYVRHLYNHRERKEDDEELTCQEKARKWFSTYLYDERPDFQYSTRIICTVFVIFMCVYQLGVGYYWINSRMISWLAVNVDTLLNLTGLPTNSSLVNNVEVSVQMIDISWSTVTLISLVLVAVDIMVILGQYRTHMIQLYKGDHTFLPMNLKGDSTEVIRNSMYFSGFQIAFMLWAFFVVNFVLWIIALVVCFLIVLPLMNGRTEVVRLLAEILLIPIALNILMRLLQYVLAKVMFLQGKINETDKDRPLALTNRRLFHVANYFFFILNIKSGLFSCLFRIVKGLVFGLCYLGRVDRCVLMSGLENKDKGYISYLGMIHLEHSHNNPTMRVFCQLLLDSQLDKSQPDNNDGGGEATIENGFNHNNKARELQSPLVHNVHQRARNRWRLLYTLVRNPMLLVDRCRMSQSDLQSEDGSEKDKDPKTILLLAQHRRYLLLRGELENLEKDLYGFSRKRASFGCQVTGDDLSYFHLDLANSPTLVAGNHVSEKSHLVPKSNQRSIQYGTDTNMTQAPMYDNGDDILMQEIETNTRHEKPDYVIPTGSGGRSPQSHIRHRANPDTRERESQDMERTPQNSPNGMDTKQITPVELDSDKTSWT